MLPSLKHYYKEGKMFCYQCQEALNNKGCDKSGVCGKSDKVAMLQDAVLYATIGLGEAAHKAKANDDTAGLILHGLFATVTNVNFDAADLESLIYRLVNERETLKKTAAGDVKWSAAASWAPKTYSDIAAVSSRIGVLAQQNEDLRSLRELLIYGLKGVAAYAHHAWVLNETDSALSAGIAEILSELAGNPPADKLLAMVMKCGDLAVKALALLHTANTKHYGAQEITSVPTGTRAGRGILISGHDLKDLEELLIQTEGKGIDIYTHGEMLPANAYPKFRQYKHLAGNFGSSWWKQQEEFENFSGPFLFTTNCIQKPKDSYKNRVFTTGVTAYEGCTHIPDREKGKMKDFSPVINAALASQPLGNNPGKSLTIGFGHEQVMSLAEAVVNAVKSGAVKKFVVMAGCDGRQKEREYFTDIAKALPKDNIILTAGCAKYRYNSLDLGDIGGIPRVLDAGQCNDCYSLAVIALKLKEVFELDDINKLPIAFDVAWYEQKAVAVLLALLALGFKNVRLGPTLPAFLSPNVAKTLVESFGITGTKTVQEDLAAISM